MTNSMRGMSTRVIGVDRMICVITLKTLLAILADGHIWRM